MKLVRYGDKSAERPGLIDSTGALRDLSAHVSDISGATIGPDSLKRLNALDPATLPIVPGIPRLGPCVARMGKIIGVGLNYRDHAKETGSAVPSEPMIFNKATSGLNGPYDDIILPRTSVKLDWEVELAVIIGTRAQYVGVEEAMNHVAGYAVMNDVSERAFQKERGGQFTKGKSADTFAPLGPWLVTRDEVPDPQALRLWTDVDGVRMQDGTTADMVFPVAFLVSELSQFMTFEPGDVITTGTPSGVAAGRTPPNFLTAGQVIEMGITGLGSQRARIAAPL
jgi:2-keto-4-pentenoate hydratase/2-oxohepta-3-ene-1,7-dioic acid hydratase in catechol pathway